MTTSSKGLPVATTTWALIITFTVKSAWDGDQKINRGAMTWVGKFIRKAFTRCCWPLKNTTCLFISWKMVWPILKINIVNNLSQST